MVFILLQNQMVTFSGNGNSRDEECAKPLNKSQRDLHAVNGGSKSSAAARAEAVRPSLPSDIGVIRSDKK